jgi:hypothetical protein
MFHALPQLLDRHFDDGPGHKQAADFVQSPKAILGPGEVDSPFSRSPDDDP